MSQPQGEDRKGALSGACQTGKKPYHRPEFRFERVFETQALSCGKLGTQAQCQLVVKNS